MQGAAGCFVFRDIKLIPLRVDHHREFSVHAFGGGPRRHACGAAHAGIKRALAAGLPIGFGTDALVIPHGANAKELTLRVSLGESPMSAIVSGASLNAEIIAWSDRVGSVEKGKYADLIAVTGDPLKDISLLKRVSFVMKGGEVVPP